MADDSEFKAPLPVGPKITIFRRPPNRTLNESRRQRELAAIRRKNDENLRNLCALPSEPARPVAGVQRGRKRRIVSIDLDDFVAASRKLAAESTAVHQTAAELAAQVAVDTQDRDRVTILLLNVRDLCVNYVETK